MWTLVDFWIMFSGRKMASVSEENSDISDFKGFTEEDLADNISVVPWVNKDLWTCQLKGLQPVTCTLLSQS